MRRRRWYFPGFSLLSEDKTQALYDALEHANQLFKWGWRPWG